MHKDEKDVNAKWGTKSITLAKKQIDKLNNALTEKQQLVLELASQLENAQGKIATLKLHGEEKDTQRASVKLLLDDTQGKNDNLTQELMLLKNQVTVLDDKLSNNNSQLRDIQKEIDISPRTIEWVEGENGRVDI